MHAREGIEEEEEEEEEEGLLGLHRGVSSACDTLSPSLSAFSPKGPKGSQVSWHNCCCCYLTSRLVVILSPHNNKTNNKTQYKWSKSEEGSGVCHRLVVYWPFCIFSSPQGISHSTPYIQLQSGSKPTKKGRPTAGSRKVGRVANEQSQKRAKSAEWKIAGERPPVMCGIIKSKSLQPESHFLSRSDRCRGGRGRKKGQKRRPSSGAGGRQPWAI
jgi:hypothetical protein